MVKFKMPKNSKLKIKEIENQKIKKIKKIKNSKK